ncbi:uncharacterized protein KQ657_003791 [Scheffersomyces spartinae]|uniref:Uncharacterized protein n=1 Tax=Scheffersomyces spartinae TaxID=45513 RepID=A0A9P7VCM3_9ASCO|nr:uncharacterized protein KQ657_003791 [Scheffersomyces spartinae]KAG7195265.1 hypothetical protein KQ657_003791 [Scheffersomyces spartinae]
MMVDSLGVEKIDESTYRGLKPLCKPDRAARGVYGGNLVGQALMVAMASAGEGFEPHSLHAYFVKATTDKSPLEWKVEQVSNGKTFANRHLQATQDGKITFLASVSLTKVNDFSKSVKEYEEKMEKYNKLQNASSTSDDDNDDNDDDVEPSKPIQFQTPLLKWLQNSPKLENLPTDKRFGVIKTDFKFPVEMVDLTATIEEELQNVTDRKVGFLLRWTPDEEQTRLLANGDSPGATMIKYVGLGVLSDSIFLTRLARILRVETVDLNHLVHYYSTSLDHVVYFHDHDFDPTQWMKFQFKATRFGNRRVVLEAEIFNHKNVHVATIVQEGLVYFNGLEKYAKL